MLSTIITAIFALSLLAAAVSGGSGDAMFRGAEEAVSLCIRLCGGICFWCGVMELMEESGLCSALGKLLGPVLRALFPVSTRQPALLHSLTENVSANLLGLGNAATPAGIRTAQAMAELGEQARDELPLLVVLNTASIQLIPSTIGALRAAEGAASAFDILPAVWVSSGTALCAGLGCAAVLRKIWR